MKKKITLNESKLARFSAIAGAVLASGSVDAQLIYQDINPDVLIDTASGSYDLDFNSDAIIDLTFSVVNMVGAGTTSGFTFTYNVNVANVAFGPGAGVVNLVVGTGTSASSAPAALNNGDLISVAAPFASSSASNLALVGDVVIPALSYTYPIAQGNWIGATDKFIGAKFMIGTNVHYGWVRLDVSAGADTIVVKDYAYNQNGDTPLNAGQTVGLDDVSVDNKVTIKTTLNEAMINVTPDLIGGKIVLFNMAGQLMKEVKISEINTKISFEGLDTGIYSVAAQFDGGTVNKRVYVK